MNTEKHQQGANATGGSSERDFKTRIEPLPEPKRKDPNKEAL